MKRFLWLLIIAFLFTACSNTTPEKPVTENTEIKSIGTAIPDTQTTTINSNESSHTVGTAAVSTGNTSNMTPGGAVVSEEVTTVTVHNANELYANLGSNRHFLLMPGGDYDMTKVAKSPGTVYDINSLNNIVLEGVGEKQVDFITGNENADALSFAGCSNITLKNLNMGHNPITLFICSGFVLNITSCSNITIDNCTMFGCGEVGLYADSSTNILCRNSVIRDCSGNVSELYKVEKAIFENCDFVNAVDETINLNDCKDISLIDCRLKGILTGYPQLVSDNVNLLHQASDGMEYIITEQSFPEVDLKNISLLGKSIYKEIESIHSGLEVSIELGTHELTGESYVDCNLSYDSSLDESEYLSQIDAAQKIISAYTDESSLIYVSLLRSGSKDPYAGSSYYGSILIYGDNIDLNKINNNNKKYIPAKEAREKLKSWLPPFITLNAMGIKDTFPANEYTETGLIDTEIYEGTVYYRFDVDGTTEETRYISNIFYVNAEDGSIGTYFDGNDNCPAKRASIDQIAALINYWNTDNEPIPQNEKVWTCIVNNDYIKIFSEPIDMTYYLSYKDGILTAEPYEEFYGE
ncbi:MAG TPA: right-handed parallel beta-helix repeat-containing protein [Clostridia bacterium]|nr:right-handed parallel beta-helix repeat-containing protein [Clostridia bacterium]